MDDKKTLIWPGEPPPPYGEAGRKAYAAWEKKAQEFIDGLDDSPNNDKEKD